VRVIVEADGGSRGNPGPAGYGSVVFAKDGRTVLAERKEALGVVTNNVAEYRGLIAGLEAAHELGATDVAVRMDSKLVVEQMSGRWQIKHPDMRPLARRASELQQQFTAVTFEWIPRERNKHADRLANEAMDVAAGLARVGPAPLRHEPDPAAAADAATDAAVGRANLARRVRARALLRGEFTLRSGQVSDQYFDKYLVESDPELLRDAVEAMATSLPDGDVVLAGLDLGGIPLATLLGQRAGREIRFVRKAAKEYGTRQQIEGGPVDGLGVVLIEDVITSGGAVLAAADAVRAAGGTVDTVVCLIDRQQGGRSALAAKGIAVRATLTAADLG
jgi:ribonuclease H / adenosylcobalamin/alpha-ribazole phosphatase